MHQLFVTLVSDVGGTEKPKVRQMIIEIDLLLLCVFTHCCWCWCKWSFSSASKFVTVYQWIYNYSAIMSKCIHYRPPPQSISAEWNIDHAASTQCSGDMTPSYCVMFCLQGEFHHCYLVITEYISLAPLQMQSLQASYQLLKCSFFSPWLQGLWRIQIHCSTCSSRNELVLCLIFTFVAHKMKWTDGKERLRYDY